MRGGIAAAGAAAADRQRAALVVRFRPPAPETHHKSRKLAATNRAAGPYSSQAWTPTWRVISPCLVSSTVAQRTLVPSGYRHASVNATPA